MRQLGDVSFLPFAFFFCTRFGLHLHLLFNLLLETILKNDLLPLAILGKMGEVNNIERSKVDCN